MTKLSLCLRLRSIGLFTFLAVNPCGAASRLTRSEKDFRIAVHTGKLTKVQTLRHQVSPAFINEHLLLHVACKKGYLGIVKELINAHAYMEQPNDGYQTPLSIAVEHNQYDVAEWLIQQGAHIETRSFIHKQVPLHRAAVCGHDKITALLLGANANKDVQDFEGKTPLHRSVTSGATATTKLLIDQGAKTDIADYYGQTPLDIAKTKNNPQLIKLLTPQNHERTIILVLLFMTNLGFAAYFLFFNEEEPEEESTDEQQQTQPPTAPKKPKKRPKQNAQAHKKKHAKPPPSSPNNKKRTSKKKPRAKQGVRTTLA